MLGHQKMAKSTYYYHISRLKEPDKHEEIRNHIISIFDRHKGRYGYRRITEELHKEGFMTNHKTVERLMRECGIKSMVRIKRYHSYKGEVGIVAPNIFERNFHSDKPNHKWTTDVTEFNIIGQKVYLSPVMDLYNREIISYSISDRPNMRLITSMINKAIRKIGSAEELTIHSDQGWTYQNLKYVNILRSNNIKQSMSRKGNCLDNAAMENFFGLLKSELVYLRKFSSKEEFIKELKEYIRYYNNERIKLNLNGMSPVQYRLANQITY